MSSGFQASACFVKQRKKSTLPLFVVSVKDYAGWLSSAPEEIQAWIAARAFSAKPGAACLLPGDGGAAGAVVTISDPNCPWEFANLPRLLPEGSYEAEPELEAKIAGALCLGWALGSYRFERYKKNKSKRPVLVWPEEANRELTLALAEGICLGRDLVNTPASDMGPEELAGEAVRLAKTHGATVKTIVGPALLKKGYPMIHAVGRASDRAPRLVDLTWGKAKHPMVTLVGKGVCFDTGGLDIKPGQYMKLMKKDMGGAALVLGLAHALMAQKLPIRLRVLVPAVENSVSGNAMRPLDVLPSRRGISVEVGDTDAEGRLVLADALTLASEESPDLIIDAATLTGAARVALGTAMPAIFTNTDEVWAQLEKASRKTDDPLWRLPLHGAYRGKLDSKVADISNIGNDGYGGAITAALFLQEFVGSDLAWVHMDTMGYNLETRPGRPVGGEALGLLALNALLFNRYVKKKKKGTAARDASPSSPKPAARSSAAKNSAANSSLVQKSAAKKTSVQKPGAKTPRSPAPLPKKVSPKAQVGSRRTSKKSSPSLTKKRTSTRVSATRKTVRDRTPAKNPRRAAATSKARSSRKKTSR